MNGIIDMTGLLGMICMIVVAAIFWRRKSRMMHRLHKPFTILGGFLTVIHTVAALIAISAIDGAALLVVLSGALAIGGFVISIVVLVNQKTEHKKAVRQHVIYSFASVGISIHHVILAEVLM